MGSSNYSSIILNTLTSLFHVKLIATQPDKPLGRGKKIEPATLKVLANDLHIPVIQPRKLSEDLFRDSIESYSIDLIIVAAYGKILPKWLLSFQSGCLNVHASLQLLWEHLRFRQQY
jgi:methionyl-tRNA formyltransferase